jgi:hypothetical protein
MNNTKGPKVLLSDLDIVQGRKNSYKQNGETLIFSEGFSIFF